MMNDQLQHIYEERCFVWENDAENVLISSSAGYLTV